jgi:hypothetical protein
LLNENSAPTPPCNCSLIISLQFWPSLCEMASPGLSVDD